jgi:hypothetical protein
VLVFVIILSFGKEWSRGVRKERRKEDDGGEKDDEGKEGKDESIITVEVGVCVCVCVCHW